MDASSVGQVIAWANGASILAFLVMAIVTAVKEKPLWVPGAEYRARVAQLEKVIEVMKVSAEGHREQDETVKAQQETIHMLTRQLSDMKEFYAGLLETRHKR